MSKHTLTQIFGFVFLMLMLASCSNSKQNIIMMSDLETSGSGGLQLQAPALIIQPDDELSILVSAEVPAAAAIYNLPINTATPKSDFSNSLETRRLQTYRVNKEGDITFPVFGKIHVAGMTTTALADYLHKRISENVEDPIVTVDLMSFHVKVTGDVRAPGNVWSQQEKLSVLDALASVGDINVTGRRDNVMIIRDFNGETTYQRIDLSDSKTWTPENFYLRQNDVIYVEPGPTRIDELSFNQRRSFNVTLASIMVSSISVLTSLVIALTK